MEKQEPSAAHVKWPSLTKHSHQTPSRRQSWTHMAATATEKRDNRYKSCLHGGGDGGGRPEGRA